MEQPPGRGPENSESHPDLEGNWRLYRELYNRRIYLRSIDTMGFNW